MVSELISEIDEQRRALILSLRRKSERDSSVKVALSIINFLRKVVLLEKAKTITDLVQSLHKQGRLLSAEEPSELIIVNVVMMVSKLARDEVNLKKGITGAAAYDSLYTLWRERGPNDENSVDMKKIKKDLVQSIKDVIIEVESCRDSISAQSNDLILPQDVVMVHSLAKSSTMAAFLASARRTRKYRVFNVVHSSEFEQSPDFSTPIQYCDVAAKMCETTKVVLTAATVFPDGSCLVPAGGLSIALAAQLHAVPVYVLAAFYKITPFYSPDPCAMNTSLPIRLPFRMSSKLSGKVDVMQPAFDVIPSQLVTLFVSNSSSIIPAHVNRLKEDYYHPEDISIY